MTGLPPDPRPEALDGSALCLACGLCCQGGLHSLASVEKTEADQVRSLAIEITEQGDELAFSLPCGLHRENRCTAYWDRPQVCRTYQCKLLKNYLAGETSWEESRRRVEIARELLASARRRAMRPTANVKELLLMVAEPKGEAASMDREFLMDVATLAAFARRYFLERARPPDPVLP